MSKFVNFLLRNYIFIASAYLCLLLVFVFINGITLRSDSLFYYELSRQALNTGTFYPTSLNLFDPYLVSITYINIQILLLSIYDNSVVIGIYNVLVIGFTMFFLHSVTKKVSGKATAGIAVLIYLLYPATTGLATTNLTELTFCLLMILSIRFYIQDTKSGFFFAGIFAALSTTLRPVGVFLFFALAALHYYGSFMRRKRLLNANLLTAGFILLLVLVSSGIYLSSGLPVFQPSTGGLNLLIGANDFAKGGYEAEVFRRGNLAYIDDDAKVTFFERDDFYRDLAIDWIKENPIKWLSLIPARLYYLFRSDIYAIEYITDIPLRTGEKLEALFEGPQSPLLLESGKSYLSLIIFFILLFLNHIYYFGYVIIFLTAGLVSKKLSGNILFNEIIFFITGGLLLTMVTFGSERFKYPFIISGIILLAPVIENFLRNKFKIMNYD